MNGRVAKKKPDEVMKWKKTSEETPQENLEVIIGYKEYVAVGFFFEGVFRLSHWQGVVPSITHWMPFPPPPPEAS